MNKREATKEARKRWGKAALVEHDRFAFSDKEKTRMRERNPETWKKIAYRDKCKIGRIRGIAGLQFFEIMGSGDSWAKAMAQIERRELK